MKWPVVGSFRNEGATAILKLRTVIRRAEHTIASKIEKSQSVAEPVFAFMGTG